MSPEKTKTKKANPAKKTGRKKPTKRPRAKAREVLVTGYPGFIGKRLVRKLLQTEPESTFYLLVQEKFVEDAKRYVRSFRSKNLERVHILTGDIADMHLGLSAAELKQLTRGVTDIYHLAAISYLGAPERMMKRVNVGGTQNLLEIALDTRKLKRFNHVSTSYVSGNREGVITEDELECEQGFRNPYEETKFLGDQRGRAAMDQLPITITRPSIVIGDSKTGEIGRFDGPYYLAILLASSPAAMSLVFPGDGGAPLNMVPVDYAVDAIVYLSKQAEAEGMTFQLVDPNALSVKRVYQLIGERAGIPTGRIRFGSGLTRTLLGGLSAALQRIPGLEQASRAPRQAIDLVNTMAIYNDTNTQCLLKNSGIECPPFEDYVDNLFTYVRDKLIQKRKREMDEDPLA